MRPTPGRMFFYICVTARMRYAQLLKNGSWRKQNTESGENKNPQPSNE